MSNATTEAILDNVHAALPGVADDVISQALFNVCDDLAREALNVAAPAGVDADPATWLPVEQWVPNFQALLSGVLAALYGQFGKPYFSADLAKFNQDKYLAYKTLSRTSEAYAAIKIDNPHERLVSAIRAQIPACRDATIIHELFAATNEVRIDVYLMAPLPSDRGNPVDWLALEQYMESYNALLAGTLSRIYGQAGMPWFSEPAQAASEARFRMELQKLRSTKALYEIDIAHRLVGIVRAYIPLITEPAVQLALFDVVNKIRIDALQLGPITFNNVTPPAWLNEADYEKCSMALQAGMLAALYAQPGTPWFNAEQATAQAARFAHELHQLRSHQSGRDAYTDELPERLVNTVMAQVQYIRHEAVRLPMFDVVNKIRVEVFLLPPLLASNTAYQAYLSPSQWERSYNTVLYGTLAAVYSQSNMPWYNQEQCAANSALYAHELHQLRSWYHGTDARTDTLPERLVSTVMAQIRNIRDEAVRLPLFTVANKIRAEVYSLPPLTGANTAYQLYLTDAQWQQSYNALLYGTLASLYSQSDMAWYNHDQFLAFSALFAQELDLARSENIEKEGPSGSVADDILEEARTYLPGARDEVMEFELRRVLDEFLKFTSIWQEDVRVAARPNRTSYELIPEAKAEIVRVIAMVNKVTGIGAGPFSMQTLGVLKLKYAPSEPATWLATCVLSVLTSKRAAGDNCGCGANWGVPAWILERWDEVLLNGLLWRMMMQQGKSYTNTELGVFHGQRWRAGLSDARGATRQQNVYDGQTWRYPEYA